MAEKFDRDQLLKALDKVGAAATAQRETLEIAVYGGSALMLASNFRFASEDVDIAEIARPWPRWLNDVVAQIAAENNWARDWLNEAVTFHLSAVASVADDHIAFGDFPRGAAEFGLKVYVPTARYMLALKLKAMRITDPLKGEQETQDILNLAKYLGLKAPADALAILTEYFPKSGADAEKQNFLLTHIWKMESHDAPIYIDRGR